MARYIGPKTKIARKFGTSTQLKYLKSLGLMDKLDLEIPELGKPQVLRDGKLLTTMTISYGHGIAITPLHLASATATIVNDGVEIKPTLLISNSKLSNNRIFSSDTSKKMKSIIQIYSLTGMGARFSISPFSNLIKNL